LDNLAAAGVTNKLLHGALQLEHRRITVRVELVSSLQSEYPT
jgi:hypothetical protein